MCVCVSGGGVGVGREDCEIYAAEVSQVGKESWLLTCALGTQIGL